MIKIFIADVDDTICHSTKIIDLVMADRLSRLHKTGVKLAFISGSTMDQIYGQISPDLPVDHFLLGTSGTNMTIVKDNGTILTLYYSELTKEDRRVILEALENLAYLHLIYPMTTKSDQIQDRGSQITFSALGRHAPKEAKEVFDPDRKIRARWVRCIKDTIRELGYSPERYNIGIGGTSSIDITMAGQDKGRGVEMFLDTYNKRFDEYVTFDDCVFVGDSIFPGGNDYPAAQRIKRHYKVTSLNDTKNIIDQLIGEQNGNDKNRRG